jgi:hypothetical protein
LRAHLPLLLPSLPLLIRLNGSLTARRAGAAQRSWSVTKHVITACVCASALLLSPDLWVFDGGEAAAATPHW